MAVTIGVSQTPFIRHEADSVASRLMVGKYGGVAV